MKLDYVRRFFHRLLHCCYRNRILWLWLWIISVCSLWDIVHHFNDQSYLSLRWTTYLVSVGAFKASAILILILPLLKSRFLLLKVTAWLGVGLYSLLAILNIVAVSFYDLGISAKLLRTIAATNARETAEFTGTLLSNLGDLFLSPYTYIVISVAALLVVGIRRTPRCAWLVITGLLSLVGVGMFAHFCSVSIIGRTAHSTLFRTARFSYQIYRSEKELANLKNSLKPLPFAESVATTGRCSDMVVVIGESAWRPHHSLYGYTLDTSPRLRLLKDSIFLFEDAIASAASTADNMDRILTLKADDRTSGDAFKFPRVIDLFNAAGYKTFWLSNQERSGLFSNNTPTFIAKAAVQKFIGADSSEDNLHFYYDDELLPHLRGALTDKAPNKLIFTHLMGSHVAYENRYPKNRHQFHAADELRVHKKSRPWLDAKGADILAHYDNSIRFTDSIVSQMIQMIAEDPKPAALIYFSDHGENVYCEGNSIGRGVKYVQVPFLIYLNSSYRRQNPEIVDRSRRATTLPLSTANLVHMLMTLTGTSYRLYDPLRDVLSPTFRPRIRYVEEQPSLFDHITKAKN